MRSTSHFVRRADVRPGHARRAFLLVLATFVSGLIVAGCGGSSGSRTSAGVSAPTRTSATSASTTSSRSAVRVAAAPAALRFSECMRANGVTGFPDPRPGGGFDIPSGADPGSPVFRSAQAKCQKILSAGGGPPVPGGRTDPTSRTLTKLLRIAVCMRQHGISQFPDPRTSVPADPLRLGISEVSDFDGAILLFPQSLNMQAPAYRQALTACGAPPLGLPH
jgi:hypothetical protein